MKPTYADEAEREFARALEALRNDDTLEAMACLEKGLKLREDVRMHSHLGYCIAKERGQWRRGIDLCLEALAADLDNPIHYLNLGQTYLISGRKNEAIDAFRKGMAGGGEPAIQKKLEELGIRKPLIFPFLPRANPLNKYLGLLFSRLGLR